MLKHFKELPEAKLRELAKLTGGAALMVMLALFISGTGSVSAEYSYDGSSQSAGLYWAVKNNSNFKSFTNSNSGVGPKGNLNSSNWTGSSGVGVGDNGNPAPRGCSYNSVGTAKACILNYSNSDNFNIFGVLAAYETNNPSNGGASYFRAETPLGNAGNMDGWRVFWDKPIMTRLQRFPGNTSPVDVEDEINTAFTIDKTEANQSSVVNNLGGGTFSGKRFTITNATLDGIGANNKTQEAMGASFVRPDTAQGAIGRGDAASRPIIVPAGQKVTVEWACQPYQVNYFNVRKSATTNEENAPTARILDLFDRVSREDNLSAYGNNNINNKVEITPSGDGVYSLRCVNDPIPETGRDSNVGTVYIRTDGRNGPKMQLYINTAATPVSRIQANSAAYNTNTTVNDGTSVTIHANYTTDASDDQILETRIMEGATVRATGTGADLNYTYISAGGLARTFTPQIRTKYFPNWTNYGGAVTVNVNAAARTLTVNSTGATGAVITSSPAGNNGTTNYVKTGIANGTAITLTAPALVGTANFSAWTGCDTTNATARTCTVTMSANKTVTVAYAAAARTLTVNSTGAAAVAITGSVATYSGATNYVRSAIPNGTSITLTAPAVSGTANFSAWTGCDTTNATARTCTVAMSANKTVNVTYTAALTRTLTVNSTGATGAAITSSPTGNNGTTDYVKTGITDGTAITLTAPATVGTSDFNSWVGCDTTNATARTCAVTMNANKTVTARYDICDDISGVQASVPPSPCVNPATNGGSCIPTGHTWSATLSQCVPNTPQCSDGVDNDGDGKTDFGTGPTNDPGCSSASDTDEFNVVILPPTPDITKFEANPSRVRATDKTTLSWNVTGLGAQTCSLTSNPAGFSFTVTSANALNGSTLSNGITQTTIYTLSCGAGGNDTATVTVVPAFEEI